MLIYSKANEQDLLSEIVSLAELASKGASNGGKSAAENFETASEPKKVRSDEKRGQDSSSESDSPEEREGRKKHRKKLKSGILDKAKRTKIERKVLFAHAMNSYGLFDDEVEFNAIDWNRLLFGELEIITTNRVQKHVITLSIPAKSPHCNLFSSNLHMYALYI